MRRGRGALVSVWAIGIVLASGCMAPMMAPENLPADPIAFVHWTGKSASKRTSILENATEAPATTGFQEAEIRAYLRSEMSVPVRMKLVQHPGRLSLLWPQTGEVEPIDAAPPGAIPLAWSRDHQRLLIASGHRGNKEQLYEYRLTDRVLRRITSGPDEHPRGDYREAPGDGRTGGDGPSDEGFVVQRLRNFGGETDWISTIHRANAGGRLGPPLAEGVPPGTLRYTPIGNRIVYEQVRIRPHRGRPPEFESMIAARSLDPGSSEELLLKGREPAITPDGQWVVFASASSAGYRLRRMRPDGTARVPISPGGTEERMPSVSPDGDYVVFVRMSQGKRTLAVRRFDGKGERTLLKEGSSEFPVW